MDEIEARTAAAREALTGLLVCLDPVGMSAAQWSTALVQIEGVGRLVDAARVRMAAVGDEHAEQLGRRSGVDAVAVTAGVSEREARTRIRVGAATVPRMTLTGALCPPRYSTVADALAAGALGVEAAGVIVRELDAVAVCAESGELAAAEVGLIALATGTGVSPIPATVEELTVQSKQVCAWIDPDGSRPREERALRRRMLRFGPEDPDGLIPVHGRLDLEVGTMFRTLVEAHRRVRHRGFTAHPDADPDTEGGEGSREGTRHHPTAAASADTGTPTADALAEGWADAPPERVIDTRTPDQQRHDTLAAILTAATRDPDAPALGGAAPAVLVTVSARDLDDPDGRPGDPIGQLDGSPTPLSRTRVERLIDTGGTRHVAVDPDGRIRSLGSVQRCFTPAQRLAITARDRGCVIPGCTIPARWCEVHHVVPAREGGPTHTDNGTLACWWHHSRIDTGPWRLRMQNGVPHVRGPGYPHWTRAAPPPESGRHPTTTTRVG